MGKIKNMLFGTSQKSLSDTETHIELGDAVIIDSLYDDTYIIIQLEDDVNVANVHPIKQAFICENLRPINEEIINLSNHGEYVAPEMSYMKSLCKKVFDDREVKESGEENNQNCH